MTVNTTPVETNYTGNASTTVFALTFAFAANAHVKVYLAGVLQNSGYSITGAGNPSGGTLTFSAAPGSGVAIKARRVTPLTQEIDVVNNATVFASSLETGLDYALMRQQEEEFDRVQLGITFAIDAAAVDADATAAAASATSALAAKTAAETAKTQAETAKDAAEEARDQAVSASPVGKYPTFNAQSGSGTALANLNAQVALADPGEQVWNPSQILVTARPTNTVGALIEGTPVYYEPVDTGSAGRDGGRRVWNLPGRLHQSFGQEYLFPRFQYILEVGGSPLIVLASDSTGAGYQGALVAEMLARYPGATVLNHSQSGATLEQWRTATGAYASGQPGDGMGLAATMALDPDLLIVGFDTNASYVSGSTLQQIFDARRTAYTTIRAHANGSLQSLSLCTLTPASMNDTAAGAGQDRDQLYAHNLVAGIRAICADFQSAFFSQYDLCPDAAWTDFTSGPAQNTVVDSARVHPENAFKTALAQALYDFLIPPYYSNRQSINTKDGDDLFTTYPKGVTLCRATTDWPNNGYTVTFRPQNSGNAAEYPLQLNWSATAGARVGIRYASASGFGDWVSLGNTAWTNVTPGSGFTIGGEPMRVRIDGTTGQIDGFITMDTPAAISAGTTVCAVPNTMRPLRDQWRSSVNVVVWNGSDASLDSSWEILRAKIGTDGNIICAQAGALTPSRVYVFGSWPV